MDPTNPMMGAMQMQQMPQAQAPMAPPLPMQSDQAQVEQKFQVLSRALDMFGKELLNSPAGLAGDDKLGNEISAMANKLMRMNIKRKQMLSSAMDAVQAAPLLGQM